MYPFHALLLFAANAAAGITATASITEADDTLSATGTVLIQATAGITEADDTLASTATVLVQAAAGITEADDTLAGTGTVLIQAAAAITEAGDTLAATGTVGEAVVEVAETPSGGWARAFRDESDTAREARIHAERVRLGILPSEPSEPSETTAAEAAHAAIEGVPATLLFPDPALAVDLAGLYAGAWLDQEIKRHFELQDDDDAAVLLLAIAALH